MGKDQSLNLDKNHTEFAEVQEMFKKGNLCYKIDIYFFKA